mgnify:CR=1 FL=1
MQQNINTLIHMTMLEQIKQTAEYIRKSVGRLPDTGIILGTGLGELVDHIDIVKEILTLQCPRMEGVSLPADKSYTLNATEVHGVAYSFDPGASRDVGALFIEECGKTLTNGTCPGHHDGVVIARPAITASKASFFMNTDEERASTLVATDYKDPQLVAFDTSKHRYIVRRLTPTEGARLQGFADRWGDIEPKSDFTDKEYRFWLEVRNTHAAINGKAVKEYNKKQMLTWYNKLHTDSAEYKLWGNGIALPTALYVIQGIAEVET